MCNKVFWVTILMTVPCNIAPWFPQWVCTLLPIHEFLSLACIKSEVLSSLSGSCSSSLAYPPHPPSLGTKPWTLTQPDSKVKSITCWGSGANFSWKFAIPWCLSGWPSITKPRFPTSVLYLPLANRDKWSRKSISFKPEWTWISVSCPPLIAHMNLCNLFHLYVLHFSLL